MLKNAKKPTISTKNISPETKSLIAAHKKATKEIIDSDGSREFLIKTGIYTKTGKLSKAYR